MLFASFNHIKFLDSGIHVYFRPIGQIARGVTTRYGVTRKRRKQRWKAYKTGDLEVTKDKITINPKRKTIKS